MDEVVVVDQPSVRALTTGRWIYALIGILSAGVGVALLAQPGDSLETLAIIAGIFIVVDGLLEIAVSLLHSTRNRGLIALLGVVTAIVGVLLIRHPVESITAIALLIAIWMIAVGVVRCIAAFDSDEHRGWNILAGAIELIVGIVIVANPDIGYTTLAVLVGIGFILNGVGMLAIAWSMHVVRRAAGL